MTVPADQAARDRIDDDLDATLFVEAGAGTGKTTALVGRVVSLVARGRVRSARELAAITFTEAAAAELRDRVREGLEKAATSLELDDDARARVERILADVDEIVITTLHGFASRLLGEYPLEAGLPPGFEVEDEIEASVRFDRRWADLVDDLHSDPATRPALARGLLIGLQLRRLREAASVLEHNWDRVPLGPPAPALPAVVVGDLAAALDEALDRRSVCLDDGDLLAEHLDTVVQPFRRELDVLVEVGEDDALLGVVARADKLTCSRGRAGNWGDSKGEVTGALDRAEAARQAVLAEHRQAVMAVLIGRLAHFARDGAEDRRRRGLVSYHDLLVRARDLLREDAAVRTALADRYRHLLIDEFQDTDPLQIEIAALLAAADPAAEPGPWDTIEVVRGKLFFVGDPKQSIYRFRRADIALYAKAQEAFGADLVHLTANFRSVPAVLDWVNAVFGRLIEPEGEVQPPYVPLDASRAVAGERPAVLVVGGPVEGVTAPTLRETEAAELAALIGRMRAEGWEVGRDERRPLRYDDVALLVPTRTPLGQIERALEAAGIPYRIESRSLVFQTDEVRELLAILAAVDDPADAVALVAALRSPGLACSDADLADWRLAGGRWQLDAPVPDGLEDHPVARALAALARHHADRDHLPVSALVDRIVGDRRLVELTLARRRPRDHWRRYRFVTDAARAFVEAGGTSLAEFVAWVSAQADAGADRIETAVPEPDDEAVRIMTVHGAKGLEFPVVVLAGLNADRDPRHPIVAWGPGGPEVRMGSKEHGYVETAGYDAVRAGDQRFEVAERIRLLYVAATRAQDHLVVSLHHRVGGRTHAELLHDACTACPDLHERPEQVEFDLGIEVGALLAPVEPDDAADRWRAEREALLAGARASGAVAPSGLGHDVWVPRPEADQRVPGRGEGGTARGRAVHAVLETVALPGAEDLDDLARREAEHEGLVDRAEEVATLARAALAAPVVRRALDAPRRWRELPVVTRVGERVLEGVIDLAFEDADGALVVVDHKTDTLADEPDAVAAAGRYRLQLAAYALALGQATGRPVREAWLVFARPDGAVEVRIDDLDAAVAEVIAELTG